MSSGPATARNRASPKASSAQETLEREQTAKWMQNLALIEWQVARMAAGCHEAASSSQSSRARREASRLSASYALSSYALSTGPSILVQVLSLVAMAELYNQVWVEEGRAATEFGEQSKPVEAAVVEIRQRVREHAGKYLSSGEIGSVEELVHAWRKAHPAVRDVGFIRFDAFAEEYASAAGRTVDTGGMFGRITGEARNLEFLGERLLLVMNRMPRLAEWQAEAFAADLLDEPEIVDTFATIKQVGELQGPLLEGLKSLEALDQRLASMPSNLALAITQQPELKDGLAEVQNTVQRVQALEQSVRALEKSVNSLDTHLTQIATSVHPDTLRQLTDHAAGVAWTRVRSILLLTTACGAALLVLHALLRQWKSPPQPRS